MEVFIIIFILLLIILAFTYNFFLGIFSVLLLVGFFTWVFRSGDRALKEYEENEKKLGEKIRESYLKLNFKPTQKYFSSVNNSYFAMDENNKKLCIISVNRMSNVPKVNPRVIDYKDVLEAEIIEDGISVTKTSRGSQIGRTLLGGVVAGGLGAVIGGLSAKTITTNEVSKIQLQIVINDTKIPIKKITFLNSEKPIKKDTQEYRTAIQKANHWHKLMTIVIKQADTYDNEKQEKVVTNERNIENSTSSVADELTKLSQLKKEGFLTDEEFQKQKQKLLD